MQHLNVDPTQPEQKALHAAAAVLSASGLVAFATDTLYGLAVDPRDPVAVGRLYEAKSRPASRAIPLIAADVEQVLSCVVNVTPLACRLADEFWPGPLSLILVGAPTLDSRILASDESVAIRVPACPVARALAATFGHPVTATSANRSGSDPAADAMSVVRSVGDQLDLVLDSGRTPGGLSSTIVDARNELPVLVREGVVPWDRVLQSVA